MSSSWAAAVAGVPLSLVVAEPVGYFRPPCICLPVPTQSPSVRAEPVGYMTLTTAVKALRAQSPSSVLTRSRWVAVVAQAPQLLPECRHP